ncbi:MAG: hypothetical protein LAP85_02225 [Acidobacteriia bacterium]|nr:hypothetical protein [Terriglobia bacterium]
MKKALLLLAIGLCLVAVVLAAPDFSGTWVPNAEKTAAANPAPAGGGGGGGGGGRGGGGGGGAELTIKMTATEMTTSRMMGQNPVETKYVLDGKENTVNTGRGDMKYTATWNGDVLVISGSQTGRDGTPSPIKYEYSVSADGKTLTVATTSSMGGTERVRKQIYDKK